MVAYGVLILINILQLLCFKIMNDAVIDVYYLRLD